MILINLLPYREAFKKQRKQQFFAKLALMGLLGFGIAFLMHSWYNEKKIIQLARNSTYEAQIKELDLDIEEVTKLKKEIFSLRARQKAVEDLQSDRNLPVYLLSQLTKNLPDGVYLMNVRQEGQVVFISGVAQSQERISELLRNLSANNASWLSSPELVEIVASNLVRNKEQWRVSNFTVRASLSAQNNTASVF